MTEKKKNIPELRFPEFDGEWKEKTLGSISSFSKGKGLSKDDIDKNGVLECIRYGELYTNYNETIRNVISRTNINVKELVLSQNGDVIIPASGETQIDIATASCILKDGVALGGDINIIRSNADGVFLAFYLNNKKRIDIARLSQGISVVHLYASQLKSLAIFYPLLIEQQKIASFLTSVDERIQQLTKKKELLEKYKKGIMQKIFSQQIRFKDDDGKDFPDWEMKKLGELLTIKYGKDYRQLRTGNIPVYGTGGIISYVDNYIYDKPSILIGRKGTINRPKYVEEKFWTVDTLFYSEIKENHYPKFIFFIAININWMKFNEATGVPSLNTKSIANVKCFIPRLIEQQKIADFLSSIDKKIETVATQLAKTKEFKKGLLQKMFV